ncbi:hypothetical protein [Vibrio owensii]|uniref:hypothetical protein n=1 Tax=Vibrio owensii TaxID=696485 RepID=UPI0018F16EA0|nr:hypothetical protein [Vibrio owensii]
MRRTLFLSVALFGFNATASVEGDLGRNAFVVGMCQTYASSGRVFELFSEQGKSASELWDASRMDVLTSAVVHRVDTRTRDFLTWGKEKAYLDLERMSPQAAYQKNHCSSYLMSIYGHKYD